MKLGNRVLTLILAMLLLGSLTAWAEPMATVSGLVCDPHGAAVPGAVVTLSSRDNAVTAQATSDGRGVYRIDRVLPGEYLISATADGFSSSAPQTLQTKTDEAAHADLRLRLTAVATSIVVTASGTAQRADELAKAVSVVGAASIDELDKASVTDALSYVPGLRVNQEGGPGGIVTIRTRGLRAQDTAVLLDGFRFRDASGTQGDASWLLQDLLVTNLDRIEVLRGTGSSIYGTDATGGVVNLISVTPGGATRGSLRLEGGSMATFRGRGNVSGELLHGRLGYSLGVAHLNVGNGLDGHLPSRTSSLQSGFEATLGSRTRLSGRFYVTDSFSRLSDAPTVLSTAPTAGIVDAKPLSGAALRQFENGDALGSLNLGQANFVSDYDNPDYNRAARVYAGSLRVNTRLSDNAGLTFSYQGLASHRRYDNGPLGVSYSTDFPAGYQPYGGNEIYDDDGLIHTVSAQLDWRIDSHQQVNAGYEFENENYYGRTLEPSASEDSTADITQRNQAVFVQDQLHLMHQRLQLAGSYRGQFFRLDHPTLAPASSNPYSGLTFAAPPAAHTWDASTAYLFASGTKLRSHVGTGYRAPSLYERFGTYFSSYGGYSAYGNPELKPERTTAVDAGVEQTFWSGRAQASATYFYTWLREVINYGAVSAGDPYGRYTGYSNTKGGIARGVESSLSLQPLHTLKLQASYTYTNAREKQPVVAGVYQTFGVPDHRFTLVANEQFTPRFAVVFGTELESSYLAELYNDYTYAEQAFRFRGKRHGQLGANYRLPLGEARSLRLFANVENVFHQHYYESGYRTPGTTAMSGAQFEF